MASHIEDYAMIGDSHTAALVSKNGSIDWFCLPRFDSGACFAALLGSPENGRWLLAPESSSFQVSRRYQPDTLVLETEFHTAKGSVTLVDFMPQRERHPHLVRLVRGDQGEVRMRTEIIFRFDYGELVPWVIRLADGALRAVAGPNMVVLRSPAPLRGENLKTYSEFTVKAGETIPFVLSYGHSERPVPEAIDPHAALERTVDLWKKWISRSMYRGPYQETVKRSLITLKALTYQPTGGITAAPTTSLPEKIGGKRNWDYRYCWLRDATLTLRVLSDSGFNQEAQDWRDWLIRAAAGSPDKVQIMYGLDGERHLKEWELDWLSGYECSKPVRVGNAAVEQLQLDVYGELSAVMHRARRGQFSEHEHGIELEWALLDHLEKIWREPDQGIWEVRGSRRQFTHSKVMSWVAFDSAIKSCEQFGLRGPLDRWRKVRQEIHDDVCRNGFNFKLGSFVQFYGSNNIDASLLFIPRVGFLPGADERVRGTIGALERNLMRGGLLMRYKTEETDDGLRGDEGVFLPCSFWLADAYVLSGRIDDARKLFESLLKITNDVNLLSEEYDPVAKRLLGNFPEALSHVALVDTALLLSRSSQAPRDPKTKSATNGS